MALVPTLTQVNPAITGQPIRFLLAVLSTESVTALTVTSVVPSVTTAAGQLGVPFNLGGPYVSPNQSLASTTTGQFNIQITAGGTAYFTFSISLFGQTTTGAAAVGLSQFQVQAAVATSDGSVYASPAVNVALKAFLAKAKTERDTAITAATTRAAADVKAAQDAATAAIAKAQADAAAAIAAAKSKADADVKEAVAYMLAQAK